MSIEAHKCNVDGCKGHVVFENADFDFNEFNRNEEHQVYTFGEPTCSECEKEFLIVPDYSVIDARDLQNGDYEYLESACITAHDKREKELGR